MSKLVRFELYLATGLPSLWSRGLWWTLLSWAVQASSVWSSWPMKTHVLKGDCLIRVLGQLILEAKTTRMCLRQNWTRFEKGSARVNYNYIWLSPFILYMLSHALHTQTHTQSLMFCTQTQNTHSLSLSLSLHWLPHEEQCIEASCGWTAVIQQDEELPCRVSRISLLLRTFCSQNNYISQNRHWLKICHWKWYMEEKFMGPCTSSLYDIYSFQKVALSNW